jgi:cobyrinic acid a,c-diamide synthase
LPLFQTAQNPSTESILVSKIAPNRLRLAIARDQAFSFYYADNLDLLQAAGFELVEWSPMADTTLPKNIQGLYFGGGFPEVFATALSENQSMRDSVHAAIHSGMPTYAECGGLMYLCESIVDFTGIEYPMLGIIPSQAQMGKRLTLGYRQATAQAATPLLFKEEVVWGHEFHRSSLVTGPAQPLYKMQNYDRTIRSVEGWQKLRVHASYLHLHFGGKPHLLERFWQQCHAFRQEDT